MSFKFTEESIQLADAAVSKYPLGRQASAVMELLTIAQNQSKENYVTDEAIHFIAEYLSMPVIKVYEVFHFYTMYNKKPTGKYHIQICSNLSCTLRGCKNIVNKFEEQTNTKVGKLSEDKKFTISLVECLGACDRAPVAQINDNYYTNINDNSVVSIIDKLKD